MHEHDLHADMHACMCALCPVRTSTLDVELPGGAGSAAPGENVILGSCTAPAVPSSSSGSFSLGTAGFRPPLLDKPSFMGLIGPSWLPGESDTCCKVLSSDALVVARLSGDRGEPDGGWLVMLVEPCCVLLDVICIGGGTAAVALGVGPCLECTRPLSLSRCLPAAHTRQGR